MAELSEFVPEALASELPLATLTECRKLIAAVHRGDDLNGPLRGVRTVVLAAVRERFARPRLTVAHAERSAQDPFVKLALASHDGALFEAVRIPLEKVGRFSVCVSSQLGCGLACTFCATGRLGLLRNLETWEILEQVRLVREGLPAGGRIHGVVFQGMGEPLANADRVFAAIRLLHEPCAYAIDARNITVTTAGVAPGIVRLARELPRVRLGWSIGSAREEVRRQLMPIAVAHPLADVERALVLHATCTELAPLWAYAPLAGVNDTPADVEALGALVERFVAASGRRPRVTLVPYNPIGDGSGAGDRYRRQTDDEEVAFRQALRDVGVFAHKRYSGGSDVGAACGQLVADHGPATLVALRKSRGVRGVAEVPTAAVEHGAPPAAEPARVT